MSDTVKLVTDLKEYTGTLSGNTDQVLVVHNNNETVRVPFDQFKNSQTVPSVPTSPTSDGTDGAISVTENAVYTYVNGEWGKSPRDLDWGAEYLRIDQGNVTVTVEQKDVLRDRLPTAEENAPGIVPLAVDHTKSYPTNYAASPAYVKSYIKSLNTDNVVIGLSAYDIAVENGFRGTEEEWLESLRGPQGIEGPQGQIGPPGLPGPQGVQGPKGDPFTYDDFTEEEKTQLLGPIYDELNGTPHPSLPQIPSMDGECNAIRLGNTSVPTGLTFSKVVIPVANTVTTPLYMAAFVKTVGTDAVVHRQISIEPKTWTAGDRAEWVFQEPLTKSEGEYVELYLCTSPSVVTGTDAPAPGTYIRIYYQTVSDTDSGYRYGGRFYWSRGVYVELYSVGHVSDYSIHMSPEDKAEFNTLNTKSSYWDASMLAATSYDSTMNLTANDNYSAAYGFVSYTKLSGNFYALDVVCRSGGATIDESPVWIKVWRVESDGTKTLIGKSINSQSHREDTTLHYVFEEPFAVEDGQELRVSFHTADGLSVTSYQMGIGSCLRLATVTAGEGGILDNAGNIIYNNKIALYKWYVVAAGVEGPPGPQGPQGEPGLTQQQIDLLTLYASAEGRNVPLNADGTFDTAIGHTYVVTARGEEIEVTNKFGDVLATIPAGKQLGFVANSIITYVSTIDCTVTEVFRCAASVELSGSGFPDGVYVCYNEARTVSPLHNLKGLTKGSYLFQGTTGMTSFEGDTAALTIGNYMFQNSRIATFTGDLSALKDGTYMFAQNSMLKTLNCNNFNSLQTSNYMFYMDSGLTEFDYELPSLSTGNGMFEGTGLKQYTKELPMLTSGHSMFKVCRSFVTFRSSLPKMTTGAHMFGQNSNMTVFEADLPVMTNGDSMFIACALTGFECDMPALTNGNFMFSSCTVMKRFAGALPVLSNGSAMFYRNFELTSFEADLPALSSGSNMFGQSILDKTSALRILNSIPAYTSGTHQLNIGIHVDHKTDEEVLAAIDAATAKGWNVVLAWNGEATA